jgi:hypothetical protein
MYNAFVFSCGKYGIDAMSKRTITRFITQASFVLALAVLFSCVPSTLTAEMLAGVARVDITDRQAGPVNDPLYVKALVLKSDTTWSVIITVDAVAIGEIGRIGNDYLPAVRSEIEKALGIPAANVLVNASHCHGVVRGDVDAQTIEAVKRAASKMVPVHVGVGRGHEDRIMENRRLIMKDGREIDVRHAYSMPPDDEVAAVGPIDPEIGVLRIDRTDGRTLAVLYNFACHPIQGVPSKANTADIIGFASKAIEENLDDDTLALFLQGCGGDINPVFYKDVDHPRSAEPLGNMLGLSTLRALRKVNTRPDKRLKVVNQTLELPRADLAQRIIELQTQREQLAGSLRGTTLNLKTFVPLLVKQKLSGEFPSYYSQRYLHEQSLGRDDLSKLDAENRSAIKQYVGNIETMEKLTRLNTNLDLLRKHQTQNMQAEKRTIDVELTGLRIGDFVLTSFPGELTVQIGLNIKDTSPHDFTFVAGYTNGYIYYAPTTEQLKNVGGAQEDSDCILAPHWQAIYEKKAAEILSQL